MPRPKNLSSYPSELLDLASRLATENLFLHFPTHREAAAVRLTLYGLKGAIRHEQASSLYPDFMASRITIYPSKSGSGFTLALQAPEEALTYTKIFSAITEATPRIRPGGLLTPPAVGGARALEPQIPFEDVFENMLARDLASRKTEAETKPDTDAPAPEDSAPTSPLTFDED